MLLTPTYHVFDMYKVHQDARMLPVEFENVPYSLGDESIPQLSVSASMDSDGVIHLSACNLSHDEPVQLRCSVEGLVRSAVNGQILGGHKLDADNTFEHPDAIHPEPLSGIALEEGILNFNLPPASVAVLALR
jgi:alpha-N-arabinofuranosidase